MTRARKTAARKARRGIVRSINEEFKARYAPGTEGWERIQQSLQLGPIARWLTGDDSVFDVSEIP